MRLRQGVWSLVADHAEVLPSLRLTAGLGVAVHGHAAASHGVDLTAPDAAGSTGPGASSRTAAHGNACIRLSRSSRSWLRPSRASGTMPSRLLGCSAAHTLDAPRGHLPIATADRHIGAALNGAVQVMVDIAVHEGAAFDRLSRAGLLQIPARALPRDLVTDNPDIATARLGGRTVPAPREILRAVAGMYAEVAAHPIGVPTSRPVGNRAIGSRAEATSMV